LATRVLQQPDDERIDYIWEVVTSRRPDDNERAVLKSLISDLFEQYQQAPELANELCRGIEIAGAEKPALAAWTMVGNVLYNLDIVKTKE